MIWLSAVPLLLSLLALALSCQTARSMRNTERRIRAMLGPCSQPYRYWKAEKRADHQTTRQVARKR